MKKRHLNLKTLALVAGVGWLACFGGLVRAESTRVVIRDETARFRVAVAAFEALGWHGGRHLGEEVADRLARDLARQNREFEVLDPEDVERTLRRAGWDYLPRLDPEGARELWMILRANTLIVGQVHASRGTLQAEALWLRTGESLGVVRLRGFDPYGWPRSTSELARRLWRLVPLEGYVTDLGRRGEFEFDLGRKHGLERGAAVVLVQEREERGRDGRWYVYDEEIGRAQVIDVGFRDAEAEIIELDYGVRLHLGDRVQVWPQLGYVIPEPPMPCLAGLEMNKPNGAAYVSGERFTLTYWVAQDSPVEIWDHRPDGKRVLVVRHDRLRAGQRYTLRGVITPPYGREQLVLKAWPAGRYVEAGVDFRVLPR